jgi:hypothetical protein
MRKISLTVVIAMLLNLLGGPLAAAGFTRAPTAPPVVPKTGQEPTNFVLKKEDHKKKKHHKRHHRRHHKKHHGRHHHHKHKVNGERQTGKQGQGNKHKHTGKKHHRKKK